MTVFQLKCSCVKCKQETTTGQLTRRHKNFCPVPIVVKYPNFVGRPAWNKGNRSKPDTRNPEYIGSQGGYRANAGRSKKFKVYDSFGIQTTLQSTFEYACFEILCELGINWIRPKALKYENRNYFADFYLPDFNVWLDPKNDYKAKCDAEKIAAVIDQNKVNLFVLNEKQITKEYIGRVIQR